MLAQAAHDLQEPLRLLSGYLDLLVAHLDEHAPLDGPKLARDARDTAERMQQLVASVLDEARAQASSSSVPVLPRESVPLANALQDAQKNLARRIRESGAHVTVTDPLPTLKGDRGQLTRLFQNLLENSVKYGAAGTQHPAQVRISTIESSTEWIVCVDDDGPGWPAGRERLFQPYVRLHHAATPGAGLGLAAVRAIVEGMNGRVRALDAPGGGARVEMRFPR